jgi:hypothetical protein
MITHRIRIWQNDGRDTFLNPEAKHLIRLPCNVKTYELLGEDGKKANIAIFPMNKPPVALIEPDSAQWAEEVVEKIEFEHET